MLVVPVVAGMVLFATVAVGVLVHEYLHVLILRAGNVRCSVVFRPKSTQRGRFQGLISGSLASVEIESIPSACSAWRLRLAALAPLAMLLPVGAYAWLVTSGTESLFTSMVVIGWMACALPSPGDFAIVWHTEETRETLPMESSAQR